MKVRQRSWLCWGLSLSLASLTFLLWPELDLLIALQFHDPNHQFPANQLHLVQAVYVWAPPLGTLLTVLALLGLILRKWRMTLVPRGLWRKCLAWMLVVVIGVGLVVHEALKNQVGRPRPHQIQPMGGHAPFVPALQISTHCDRNCSFVSGHAAIGYALMVLGLWSTPSVRRRWWLAGFAAGSLIGLIRMLQGGHFLSDVLFSMLAIWGSSLMIRMVWLHWRLYGLRRSAPPAVYASPSRT